MNQLLYSSLLLLLLHYRVSADVDTRINLGVDRFDDEAKQVLVSVEEDSSSSSGSESREGRLFGWFNNLFGSRSPPPPRNCGHPDNCPPHACRYDPAVIHGYCCGCAHPTDRVHVVCPPDIECPLYGGNLCQDYNFMLDCCC